MSDSKQNHKINRFFAEFIAKLRKWLNKIGSPIRISRRLVRQLLGTSKGQRKGVNKGAGFVLPTVTLVTLIVTLLVVTTVARSSDRAKTASNARQEQVFRIAATPLVDRARAKIDALLNDSKLPRTTPPEASLDSVLSDSKYTLRDETRLQLVYDFDTPLPSPKPSPLPKSQPNDVINYGGSLENREYVSSAWKFPIDTDNNGKFDSYGIYSILFRARSSKIKDRPVLPIEARALPMDETTLLGACVSADNITNIAGEGGWTPSSDGRLRKAFFVYAVTVPISDVKSFGDASGNYELYKGVTTISAVELQQDRARLPQNNNAVFFEGDLELVKVATFRLNGRIYTSGNLMVGAAPNNPITLYQVSSSGGEEGKATSSPKLQGSCYYEKKNSEIVVAGQVVEGDAVSDDVTTLSTSANVTVDLFQGSGSPPDTVTGGQKTITETVQSVNSANDKSSNIALNEFAYNRRISALVEAAILLSPTFDTDPPSVKDDLTKRIQDEALSTPAEIATARRAAFTAYFSERTHKVSYREVPFGTNETLPTTLLTKIPNATAPIDFAPPVSWIFPGFKGNFGKALDISNPFGFDGKGGVLDDTKGLTLLTSNNRLGLAAADPEKVKIDNEKFLGDRVLVGNGFPYKWLQNNTTSGNLEFVSGSIPNAISTVSNSVRWNVTDNTSSVSERYRFSRATPLSSLGVTDRGGFWEISAALDPAIADPTKAELTPNSTPSTGGLRVVTNAGIYSRRPADTFLPRFRTGVPDISTTTWDESSMPLWNGQAIDNPITVIKETNFATSGNPSTTTDPTVDGEKETKNYVVWPDSMPMTNSSAISPADNRKGDLQMRATAVYHYKYDAYNAIRTPTDYQLPIACVSSYYDPSTPTTAKNGLVKGATAPWNANAQGRSNNGLVYAVGQTAGTVTFNSVSYDPTNGLFSVVDAARNPQGTTASLEQRLAYQANLIFPNGRFANEPLREVLIKAAGKTGLAANLTLSQQSTLDANLCALQILDGSIDVIANPLAIGTAPVIQIPHGTFRESAFLDGRQVKSLNRNESLTESANGNNPRDDSAANGLPIISKNRGDIYDLEMEQRQPLEIRATDIDIDRLRGSKVTGGNNTGVTGVTGVTVDYLLPYSGIVYATREDALEDRSYYNKITAANVCTTPTTTTTVASTTVTTVDSPCETSDNDRKNLSSTDFLLDPTRKPTSIRLINGYRLWRSALTGDLTNVNGSAIVSDVTYANYKWDQATKGEKGLTLVSNLPVYVKAQVDPNNANATPSFNKHTKEEFTLALNESLADKSAIWDNFYKRHAANGNGDKLDGDFACRPSQTTSCPNGDEWRPATVLADAVTVLSANFRDGYRTDGDYDLRNNANTSTSINWQSQLNANNEKVKDSSYVLDLRRNGFFNNTFATSATWLNTKNSDLGTGSNTNLWPGSPQSNPPINGNLASYNANGVTPVQRRTSFSEYGMEICRKIPTSECTFSDWVKEGAGTTTLPVFNATTGLVDTSATPVVAPRYISDADTRFARRLSFLRFDDIYKDGNQQLIFEGECTDTDTGKFWPMPIGVQNGNSATNGYTFPQVLGDLATPFQKSNNYSYGNVPCPEFGLTVGIYNSDNNDEDRDEDLQIIEGRRRDQNTRGSLETQLDQAVLPLVSWGSGNDLDLGTSPDPKGSVTNSNDNNLGGVAPAAGGGSKSTNNAVYRRYNFNVKLRNRQLLAAGESVRVKVTLSRVNGNTYPGKAGVSPYPSLADGTTNNKADYINALYNGTSTLNGGKSLPNVNPNTGVNITSAAPAYTANFGAVYPRLPAGLANGSLVPEADKCPDATNATATDGEYCAVISWTGATSPTDPDVKVVTVLVVRDSADENGDEEFKLRLDNLRGPSTGVFYEAQQRSAFIRREALNCTPTNALTNNDDRPYICPTPVPTPTPSPGNTPSPTPTATPRPVGGVVSINPPVFANLPNVTGVPFSMILPPAAAYPFTHSTGDITLRSFNPPTTTTSGTVGSEGGRYVWGNDDNGDGTPDNPNIFPNIPPRPGASGAIPMLPGNFTDAVTSSDNNQQMRRDRPTDVDRTLWYRTAGGKDNWIGEGENIRYKADGNLFINNLSFPKIGGGASGTLRANLNSLGSLILPNTPCIDTANGNVDARCASKSYLFNSNATYPLGNTATAETAPTVLNLNLPYNPHFPSNDESDRDILNGGGVEPASSFVVCGGTGKTHHYQAIERPALGKTDISSGSCDQGANQAGQAIRQFVGTWPTGTGTVLTGGAGILSAKLNPGNTGADAFVGLSPLVSNTLPLISTAVFPTPPAIDPVLRAVNTYADNRVHVYNVSNLGKLDGGVRILNGTLTFRANCADPVSGVNSATCTPTSVKRGPSPVFIMRGEPEESVEFSGLKIVLDGVDPNNIFWVASRAKPRVCLSFNNGQPGKFLSNGSNNNDPCGQQPSLSNDEDPRLSTGKRIVLSGSKLPPEFGGNDTSFYVVNRSGTTFQLSLTLGGLPINFTLPAGVQGYDTRISSEPNFIFSGGTFTSPNSRTGATTPNIITGNFLGYTTTSTTTPTEDNTSVFTVKDRYSSFRGVRFLGLWGDADKIDPKTKETLFVAMTTVNQPALLPVLQLNVPNAADANGENIDQPDPNTTSGINGTPDSNKGQWTIRPVKTEVNVYFVAGSSPSRNGMSYMTSSTLYGKGASVNSTGTAISTGETGGGLANFVRFLENWEDVPIKIAGGFIQNTRSKFATAPFESTAPLDASGISDMLTVFLNPAQPGTGKTDGLIAGGADLEYMSKTGKRIPYFTAPLRLWGYDVGLLTQPPDRFAERFASPIAGSNEFFREINADDPWVEVLLCGLEQNTPTQNADVPTAYTKRALRGNDLRKACDSKKYGGPNTNDNISSSVYVSP